MKYKVETAGMWNCFSCLLFVAFGQVMEYYELITNVLYVRLYVPVPAIRTVGLFSGFRPVYAFSDLPVMKPFAGINGEDFPS